MGPYSIGIEQMTNIKSQIASSAIAGEAMTNKISKSKFQTFDIGEFNILFEI